MRMAAIYARVSSEQQREANTIASQTASLIEFAQRHDLEVPKEWVFEDDGYSGATLERPGLERVLAQGEDTSSALRNAKLDLLAKYSDQVKTRAWGRRMNRDRVTIDWRFTCKQARLKFGSKRNHITRSRY